MRSFLGPAGKNSRSASMISYDSLVAHSRERSMPAGKLRGALREYIQILALKALYSKRTAQDIVFLGGTALRLGHGLARFSEELDFDVKALSLARWKTLLEEIAHSLSLRGFSVSAHAAERGGL